MEAFFIIIQRIIFLRPDRQKMKLAEQIEKRAGGKVSVREATCPRS
jgi:hypothetical protein